MESWTALSLPILSHKPAKQTWWEKPSKRFLFYLLCFLSGVAVADWRSWPSKICLIAVIIAAVAVYFFKRPVFRLFCLSLLFFVVGAWRLSAANEQYRQSLPPEAQVYNLEARVCRELLPRPAYQEIEACLADGRRVQVLAAKFPELNYDDRLSFSCRPERMIERKRSLAARGLIGVCAFPKIRATAGPADDWRAVLLRWRQRAAGYVSLGMPEPAAGLAKALVLGYMNTFDQQTSQRFSRTGTSHFISIGGMHMSIMIAALLWLLIGLGLRRQVAYLLALPLLVIYLALVGFPAPAARSVVMAITVIAAFFSGRLANVGGSLLLAAVVLVAINPLILLGDISFQLSFITLAAIVYTGQPLLEKAERPRVVARWRQALGWLMAGMAVTVAAQLAALPLVANLFGQLSLVAPLANLAIVPLAAPVLWSILLGIILSFVGLPPLVVFAPATLLNSFIVWSVNFFSAWPWAVINLPVFSGAGIAAYYALLLAVFWLFRQYLTYKLENRQ